MEFGERLKKARNQAGKTQEMVSKDLHVSRQTISSWETERSYPDINSLIRISDYYGLSLDTLLKEDIGMKEEISRKEELAKVNKIWGLSYAMNLVLVVALLSGSLFQINFFQMSRGVQVIFMILMLLNLSLLFFITSEKRKLVKSKVCFVENTKSFKYILGVEICLSIVAVVVTIMTKSDQAFYFLGIIAGVLVATLVLFAARKYLVKN